MAKALRTVALVVGAVALVATGIGAAVGAGILGAAGAAGGAATFAGLSAATFATIGTIASLAATALTFAASLLTKPPSVTVAGDQTQFTASKDQGLPYAIGRTSVSGFLVHEQTWDANGSKDNAYRTFFGTWSCAGPIQEIEAFQADGVTVNFVNGAAQGGFNNFMWLNTQLGHTPEPALTATSFYQYPAGWYTSSQLSGYAAFAWTLKFDTAGKVYAGGQVPTPSGVLKGVRVYDPRQDSTFPGGSGPCRALDETTYVWDGITAGLPAAENPFLNALTWALGRFSNGKRVIGMGMALAAIDVASYAHAANIADANSWKVGGVVYSTDGKWDVIKKMLAAGSGEPLQLGGILSCTVDTPRVSLATITTADIIGSASVTATPASKDRFNGVIPTYRDESQKWQLVPGAQVQIADYVTADGRPRTRGMTWELVQDVHQVSQLATYSICNSREFGPIVMPLKLRWIGYKPGDALTIASPEAGMDSQLVVIQKRNLEPTTGAVTLTMRSETTAKHVFALNMTGSPPPTPSLQVIDVTKLLLPGVSASWSAVGDDNGERPEDGATKGAPAGTDVAGRDAADLVSTVDTNIDSILAQALRQDELLQLFDARTLVNGQAVGTTFLNFQTSQIQTNAATATNFGLIGAKSSDGTGFIMNLNTVMTSATQTLGQYLSQVSAAAGNASASVTTLQSALADPTGGFARASQIVAADGSIAGYSSAAGGGSSAFVLIGQKIQLATNSAGANLTNLITWDGARWVFGSSLYIQSLVNGAVQTESLANSAAQQTSITIMSADVAVPQNATSQVVTVTFTKASAASLLKLQFFGMFWSPDDLQFACAFVLDNSTSFTAGTVNVVLDSLNSAGKMPITPFLYLQNIPAGQHTIAFSVTNNETDNVALTVKAGSALEVLEMKKGVV